MPELDFSIVLKYSDALLLGLVTSLELTLISIVIGTFIGFLVALGRRSRFKVLGAVLGVYVEFFRGTPVLIQLFWIFFALPLIIGRDLGNFVSGAIALSLFMAAITSETFRASLKTVGREQYDASVALGLTWWVQVRHIILPQAIMRAVPTLLSNCISLFKESALVSAVGVADLMFIGQNISNNTARPVEMLTIVALVYFVIAFPLTRAVTWAERVVLKKLAI